MWLHPKSLKQIGRNHRVRRTGIDKRLKLFGALIVPSN